MEPIIDIKDLNVEIEGTEILKGFDLTVHPGEIHAIMGPNGSGKSSLANALTGREGYEITGGTVEYLGEDLLEMEPDERARAGLFMAFQYPVEIPGVTVTNFMKAAINERRKAEGKDPINSKDFIQMMKEKLELMDMDKKFMSRPINEGFSGGEKKRNEIFQMAMLEPKLAVLDETDSGLDIDALKTVAHGVNQLHRDDNAFIVITHYQRILDYIIPDKVHVLYDGRIVKSGPKEVAVELEEKGYDWIKTEAKEKATVSQ